MLPSVRRNVNVLIEAGPFSAGRESDIIVLIEAEGFYAKKYGNRCDSRMDYRTKPCLIRAILGDTVVA